MAGLADVAARKVRQGRKGEEGTESSGEGRWSSGCGVLVEAFCLGQYEFL